MVYSGDCILYVINLSNIPIKKHFLRSTTQNGDLDLQKCFNFANVQTIFNPTNKN